MRLRYALVLTVAGAALAIAGCGGGGGGSGADPASLVPAGVPVFVEATLQPEGAAKANVEALAKQIAGIDDLGETIVDALEESAISNGAPLDYGKDIEPWLGDEAGLYLESYDGDEFQAGGAVVEATDTGAAQEFIDKRVAQGEDHVEHRSYEGVDYIVEPQDGKTYGVIDGFFAYGETERSFKAMVDASKGESLADQDTYSEASADVPDESVANVFADVGAIVAEAGGEIDSETQLFLDTVGIEPRKATAELSLVPGSDLIELDLSSDVVSGKPAGDASKLLESLPGGSFAAFASADFGNRFKEAIARLDATGIPGEVEPGELKTGLEAAGIDLDQIGSALGDLAVFAQGNTAQNATGAVVLTATDAEQAANTVANIGLLLRTTGTEGVTAISGNLTGFTVRSQSVGDKPLVVAAEGERIAVATGAAAAARALSAGQSATLGANPAYAEAVAALGDTPISGFIDGPAALQFATDLLSRTEESEGFEEAKPYLEKIAYVAIGSGSSGERTTARLIVGLAK